MSNLDDLVSRFNPRRTFANDHTTVEVDSVLVRVPNEHETDGWQPVYENGKLKGYLVSVEDILLDPSIVRSARVSTDRDTLAVNEKASGLVNYLWRDQHVTPFEGITFRLRVTTPIMYAQPFFRLFAAHNEFSGRYSVIEGDYYTPRNIGDEALEWFLESAGKAQALYHRMLEMGVATEMARYAHLYRFYTKFYMTISLRHLLEFLRVERIPSRHEHSEFWQIRSLLVDIVKHWAPWAFQAWEQTPRMLDFEWIKEQNIRVLPVQSFGSIETTAVLDRGQVSLLDVYGSDSLMLAALDDFPDPRQAFGHAGMQFFVIVPIHVFRQWVRHRDGTWMEPTIPFDAVVRDSMFYVPQRFRKQEGKIGNYTFSNMPDDRNEEVRRLMQDHIWDCRRGYSRMRGDNHGRPVPTEVAAMNLPYCFYIPAMWTVPVRSLMNYFSLRTDAHAQFETGQYAKAIWPMFAGRFPAVASLFAKHFHFGSWEEIKRFA